MEFPSPSGQRELALPRHPFECLGRTLDPVLAVVAFGGQQADDLIGAARSRTRNIAGRIIDARPNREFVLQRPLHLRKLRLPRRGPAAMAG